MKILNLYSGIGGNRRLWNEDEKHDITAVEYNDKIANVYQKLYPDDTVIIEDAHVYLLEHFKEYDYIWTSPPCPTHSCIRKATCNPMKKNPNKPSHKPVFPDMKLYEEIIFLRHYFKGKFTVENVMPYYEPLIEATHIDRHMFWTNFVLDTKNIQTDRRHDMSMNKWKKFTGVDLHDFGIPADLTRVVYRNCVDAKIGKYILDQSIKRSQTSIFGEFET